MDEINNIVLIGAGNVATNIGYAFREAGLNILQVYNRTPQLSQSLAEKLDSVPVTEIDSITTNADLYLFAVSDDAIGRVALKVMLQGQFVVHTSGSVSMDVLKQASERRGVLYPLQTFSKSRRIDPGNIPFCIEASNELDLKQLKSLAGKISNKVFLIDSEKRKVLHLAAVFACNFPNYMYYIAERIITGTGLDFDMLRPLIAETAAKVMDTGPAHVQTGPARRKDEKIMAQHLKLLGENEAWKNLYKSISNEIMKM